MAGLDSPREEDTERDGFLSYAGEWHALAFGALAGAVYFITGDPIVATFLWSVITGTRAVKGHLADAKKEVAYTAGGAFLGYVLIPFVRVMWGVFAPFL